MAKTKTKKTVAKKAAAPKTEEVKTDTATEETVQPTETTPVDTAFEIEDDVPMPARARSAAAAYPFRALKPGQSFKVPAEIDRSVYKNEKEADKAQAEECRKIANRLSGAKRRVEKSDPSLKFAIRTVGDGVRVWRVEAAK